MVDSNGLINPFMSTDKSIGDTFSIWTLFSHAGIYVTAIGLLIPAGFGLFCCYFSGANLPGQHTNLLQSGSMWYTIVDDNVQAAPIYRCTGKAGQPILRPCKNHVLHMEWEPTWTELTEATDTVKGSSCIWVTGYHQNPGNIISIYGLL